MGAEPVHGADRKIKRLQILNSQGLHARPATTIVKLLRKSQSIVTFTYRHRTVDAHSILHLLMLGAPRNAFIDVCVSGPDSDQTLARLERAFIDKFEDGDW